MAADDCIQLGCSCMKLGGEREVQPLFVCVATGGWPVGMLCNECHHLLKGLMSATGRNGRTGLSVERSLREEDAVRLLPSSIQVQATQLRVRGS